MCLIQKFDEEGLRTLSCFCLISSLSFSSTEDVNNFLHFLPPPLLQIDSIAWKFVCKFDLLGIDFDFVPFVGCSMVLSFRLIFQIIFNFHLCVRTIPKWICYVLLSQGYSHNYYRCDKILSLDCIINFLNVNIPIYCAYS